MERPGIVEPEKNDTDRLPTGKCNDFPEIKIKSQDNSAFCIRLLKDCAIRKLKGCVVPFSSELDPR
jgi:hypothetical protein